MNEKDYIKGRGAQINTDNRFRKGNAEHYFDDIKNVEEQRALINTNAPTTFIEVFPKTILNKVTSPDIPSGYSMNPYQGCEHGCVYCYARNSHEYWDYSAGLDFEQKILYKKNAAILLAEKLNHKNYIPENIMLSGNTDCYQPAERKYKITQAVLNVLYEYKHPMSIITKNALIERDIALLADMAKLNLVHVNFSLTTLDEKLKRVLEPRTASVRNALRTIQSLSEKGIPVNVLMAPIIPNLNDHEILPLVKEVAAHGALSVGYTIVRLNGVLPQLFEDWVVKNYPMKAAAVLDKIKEIHGGTMNDNRFGTRMRGEGKNAEMIRTQFAIARKKYLSDRTTPALDFSLFSPKGNGQLKLF